jgi:hypothetical protein
MNLRGNSAFVAEQAAPPILSAGEKKRRVVNTLSCAGPRPY